MIDNQKQLHQDSKLLWLYTAITWVVLWCVLVIIPGTRSLLVGIYEFFISLSLGRCQEIACIMNSNLLWIIILGYYIAIIVLSILLGLVLKISGRSWSVAFKATITALILFILVNLFTRGLADSLEVIIPANNVSSQQDLSTNENRPEIEQIIREARVGGQNDQEIRELLMTSYNFSINEINRALNK